jgi:hypothetical protein
MVKTSTDCFDEWLDGYSTALKMTRREYLSIKGASMKNIEWAFFAGFTVGSKRACDLFIGE